MTARSMATLYLDSRSSSEEVVLRAWRSKSSLATSMSRSRSCRVRFASRRVVISFSRAFWAALASALDSLYFRCRRRKRRVSQPHSKELETTTTRSRKRSPSTPPPESSALRPFLAGPAPSCRRRPGPSRARLRAPCSTAGTRRARAPAARTATCTRRGRPRRWRARWAGTKAVQPWPAIARGRGRGTGRVSQSGGRLRAASGRRPTAGTDRATEGNKGKTQPNPVVGSGPWTCRGSCAVSSRPGRLPGREENKATRLDDRLTVRPERNGPVGGHVGGGKNPWRSAAIRRVLVGQREDGPTW
ncbi:hypothetical protein VTK73DRAFT_2295 [Phialemonium thermophilum]|uniref:Uncharacterized protein n=1 Tax=Phialemonium thermophilum TaxID=223376 RepID=A0ABR3VSD2_9PEZI